MNSPQVPSQLAPPHLASMYDAEGVEQLRRTHRLDPAVVRGFRNHLCKHFRPTRDSNSTLADHTAIHSLQLHERCDSEIDGASKLLFRNRDGLLLESVILRFESGRTSLCVSSQVGCAAACSFCATGKMGIARNLTTDEILDQVLQAGQLLRAEERQLRNVVFMGMGEPFHNEASLHTAIETLCSPDFFDFAQSKILVSSVGVCDAMLRLAEKFPRIHQALSLHSVRQDVRAKLIPLAKRAPVDVLRQTIQRLNEMQSCPVLLEYLMLDEINDTEEDAGLLIDWIGDANVHVNLIPYNAIDNAEHLRRSHRQNAFSEQLKNSGLKVTTRHSLGHDIAAACGQLVQSENRKIAKSLHSIDSALKPNASPQTPHS